MTPEKNKQMAHLALYETGLSLKEMMSTKHAS
jgi:hypothetical protein